MSDAEIEAQELLIHYMEQAGIRLTDDVRAELNKIVRLTIEAAVEEVFESQAMQQLLAEHT